MNLAEDHLAVVPEVAHEAQDKRILLQ